MESAVICVIDDQVSFGRALCELLHVQGFRALYFASAAAFLAERAHLQRYDLIISDIQMPEMTGHEMCRVIRADSKLGRIPVILMTGDDPDNERALGIEAGADDFIGKPYRARELLAKIKSLLEIRAKELDMNEQLRNESQKSHRLEQLQQFLSPNVANLLTRDDTPQLLKPHRREVTVLFADLRRFTSFAQKAEPEEVLEVLSSYYTAVGNAAIKYRGTLGHLAGDGIMIFFNDPEPIENHKEIALQMALEAREALLTQREHWRDRLYDIDFGMGLSEGYATIGRIGFDRFAQYSVIGTVTNFASRLCGVADEGQIFVSHRFLARLQGQDCDSEAKGEVQLKGIDVPVKVHSIHSMKPKKAAY